MMKIAILSMDVEDWYHLDYFRGRECDRERSLLDGVEVYRELLHRIGLNSSFFVVGELAGRLSGLLRELAESGHDVGVHSWDHERPLTQSMQVFADDLRRSKGAVEDVLGRSVDGYRAPCFSLDRQRLEAVEQAGFRYDSSRIQFGDHPLYGAIDLSGWQRLSPNVYRRGDFFEFQVSTLRCLGRNLPVSGGGYLRIFPWALTRLLLDAYLQASELYVPYIHPFELSMQPDPPIPAGTPWRTRMRFRLGRGTVADKLEHSLGLLQQRGFRFTTFATLRNELAVA